jgi:caspase domain-containing protein
MSLYWPATDAAIEAGPRLHALIVGVGDYDHIGLNAQHPANFLSGLAPLTTTPLAAKRLARWLATDYVNDGCRLGSIELLLSPQENLKRPDGSYVAVEPATMANITIAFNRWFARCNGDKASIAFFYFAGHGISTAQQFLLPTDFGNPALPDDWECCIDFTGLQAGMMKCRAQTQLFFIDACRDAPMSALTQRNPHGKPLAGGAAFTDRVDLSAAYFAASEGRQAYGPEDQETYFCKALLLCLEGVAARKPGPKWRIDAASLSSALVSVVEVLAAVENRPLTVECRVQKPVPLHYPKGGSVLVKVDCDPDQANNEAKIAVTQGGAVVLNSPVGERRPWMGLVKAGIARIDVEFTSFAKETVDTDIAPPTYEVDVQR